MGIFSSKPKKHLSEKVNRSEVKMAILGTGGVGKSALTIQFIQNHFIADYDPTIEDSYRKQIVLVEDNRPLFLDILDTAGQEEYAAMRDQYLQTSEGVALVYSIASRNSFQDIKNYYEEFQRIKEQSKKEAIAILIGNKVDLEDSREVSTSEGELLASELGVEFLETSALTRVNVDEMFQYLASSVVFQRSAAPRRVNIKKACQ